MSAAHFEYRTASRARERARTALTVAAIAVVVLLLIVGGWRLAKQASGPKRKPVQQISLVQPPPPRPQEKPPEPPRPKEEVKEQIKTPEPEKADPAPEQAPLKLDGEASPGGTLDLGAGKGREFNEPPKLGGPGGGDRAAFFKGVLQREIREALMRNARLRSGEWQADIHVWFSPGGGIARVELVGSTGLGDTDALLRAEFANLPRLSSPPPENLPQPARLRVASRL